MAREYSKLRFTSAKATFSWNFASGRFVGYRASPPFSRKLRSAASAR
jgi:hypothetical protein